MDYAQPDGNGYNLDGGGNHIKSKASPKQPGGGFMVTVGDMKCDVSPS